MLSNKRKSKKLNLLKDQMFLTKKYVDMNDPIYDSEIEDENCFYTVVNAEEIEYSQKVSELKTRMFEDMNILSFEDFEKKCDTLIDNFFGSYNFEKFIEDLKELNVKMYNDFLVLQLIKKSFDKEDECQINVSCLLNVLNITKLINPEQVHRAFEKVLLSLDDIKLDCPSCYEIFLKYIRFSTLDNVIDKNYILKLPTGFFDSLELDSWDEQELALQNSKESEHAVDKADFPNATVSTNGTVSTDGTVSTNGTISTDGAPATDGDATTKLDENHMYAQNLENVEEKKKLKDEMWKDTMLWVLDLNMKQIQKEKKEFKQKARDFLVDFFNDGDTNEVIEFLNNTNPLFHYEFIRISIIESFSKNNMCRKYISYLLDNLCETYYFKNDIIIAFIRIIGYIDDYEIDFPKAKEMVCKFLLRCIYDDVLYPAFLSDIYKLHIGGMTGMMICNKTQHRIHNKKKLNLNNINYIWDEDDTYEKMKLKRKINNTLLEYFYSYIDEQEFYLHIDEFLPRYHDLCNYVVKKIFVLNVDINNDLNLSFKLVDYLMNRNFITEKNVEGGVIEVMNSIKDIMLDIPKYPEEFLKILNYLHEKKYISQGMFDSASEEIAAFKN
ncbi:conserved Plasmodium protein, unknown function [Plasmodium knowlesi strain H]|uniref:MI domain-containing protein n=3 Tax=Plasmodium knowlesi TaxID=5850 RepID=A0A5K1TZL7_PLAKH|nr:MA3 domain-containing protein, putative [Plasmodium knowlesi strain H]OTN65399.1 Uncharacterized protein PKNOH_S110095400 [Plasmodium knowlesi]CAA9989573.1 MA3 domain-containing protein, putative [Plasmodium knowlesi strain H]SBO22616.1 conserved Plasmodium protein, unknown function [Plasmodium knowlesi strain H]SBO23443.1 conserved Plasmodium protein, unknown function [Plasmodium knowlesi strain H]VVS79047.1 MA3 domain-containing protein, putative [Plasmodium knowlesi strain H]|eukprot:XP_002260298.1 hypothetical protein, conserved in Plasmodium species [Plasmodium knowlesi strain H]